MWSHPTLRTPVAKPLMVRVTVTVSPSSTCRPGAVASRSPLSAVAVKV
ncbi:MAG: hypothetical protein OXU94_01925 [Gammaproteobacteria bacterium]|nr:hypothetical protein [Gammaproteobacteria bacterium]